MREVKLKGTMNFSMKDGDLRMVHRDGAEDVYGDLEKITRHFFTGAEIKAEEIASQDIIDLINELGSTKQSFHDDVLVEMSLKFTRKDGTQTGDKEELGPEILLDCGGEEEEQGD